MVDPKNIVALVLSDYSVPKELRLKYAEMLVARAVRFYLEGQLDASVVEEDLYPFCKKCGEELDDTLAHDEEDEYGHKAEVEYCNLDHSIEHESKYQQEIVQLYMKK